MSDKTPELLATLIVILLISLGFYVSKRSFDENKSYIEHGYQLEPIVGYDNPQFRKACGENK